MKLSLDDDFNIIYSSGTTGVPKGIVHTHYDIRIADDAGHERPRGEAGEIVGYGPALMLGFHKQKDKTEEAIWRDEAGRSYLRSGDIGRLDAEGFLYILDRKKDMILSGGMNVCPSDIEEVLSRRMRGSPSTSGSQGSSPGRPAPQRPGQGPEEGAARSVLEPVVGRRGYARVGENRAREAPAGCKAGEKVQ